MKNVLVATLAATAFIASSASFADDIDNQLLNELNAADQASSVSSSFDGFEKADTDEFGLVQNEG